MGMARGALTITEGFNFTNTLDNFKDEVMNITKEAVDQLEDYAKNVSDQFSDGDFKIEAFPTLDLDFNLENLPKIPEAHVQIEFEDLELYLDLDITLTAGATYTLNLFTSQTPAGFAVPGLTAGAVFSVDIILIAAAEIEIGSGIHIQLDDLLTFNLELFNSNFSSITMPSGHYEFLPVTIAGEGSIQAILSLKASVGFEFESNDLRLLPSYSAGVSADMFAYVADFLMGVKGSSEANEGDCEMAAFAEYTLAVGAAAGATVAVDAYSWGPSPNTTVPIWYTTLASTCAEEKSTTSTPHTTAQAQLRNRDDLITTSVTSEESYTIVRCITSGLVNCPANLQETTSYESTVTTTVTIQSGEDPTFPAKTSASVATPMPFGTNVKRFSSTAGTPTAYTPSSTSNVKSILEGTANGTNKKLIIGLCVGLGVPFVATLAFGLFLFIRKRNKRRNENFAEQNSHNSSSNSMKTPVRAHEIPRKPVSQS
ncbi:hypothetical protein VI817_003039 [Penicillium citrinum]|nr:hypothetical protein VI817_003039 [Penicillium citrinum]